MTNPVNHRPVYLALRPRRRLLAAVAVLAALGLSAAMAVSASASVPGTPSGWSLVWSFPAGQTIRPHQGMVRAGVNSLRRVGKARPRSVCF